MRHTVQKVSFVEKINRDSKHLLVNVGVNNLDIGTETTGERNQVLTVDKCWLSDSSSGVYSENDTIVIENGCDQQKGHQTNGSILENSNEVSQKRSKSNLHI